MLTANSPGHHNMYTLPPLTLLLALICALLWIKSFAMSISATAVSATAAHMSGVVPFYRHGAGTSQWCDAYTQCRCVMYMPNTQPLTDSTLPYLKSHINPSHALSSESYGNLSEILIMICFAAHNICLADDDMCLLLMMIWILTSSVSFGSDFLSSRFLTA